jgi:hypothetical protein
MKEVFGKELLQSTHEYSEERAAEHLLKVKMHEKASTALQDFENVSQISVRMEELGGKISNLSHEQKALLLCFLFRKKWEAENKNIDLEILVGLYTYTLASKGPSPLIWAMVRNDETLFTRLNSVADFERELDKPRQELEKLLRSDPSELSAAASYQASKRLLMNYDLRALEITDLIELTPEEIYSVEFDGWISAHLLAEIVFRSVELLASSIEFMLALPLVLETGGFSAALTLAEMTSSAATLYCDIKNYRYYQMTGDQEGFTDLKTEFGDSAESADNFLFYLSLAHGVLGSKTFQKLVKKYRKDLPLVHFLSTTRRIHAGTKLKLREIEDLVAWKKPFEVASSLLKIEELVSHQLAHQYLLLKLGDPEFHTWKNQKEVFWTLLSLYFKSSKVVEVTSGFVKSQQAKER